MGTFGTGNEDLIEREAGTSFITGHTGTAFAVSGGQVIEGPMFITDRVALRLHARRPSSMPAEALSVLDLVKPPPDIVLIGTGSLAVDLDPAVIQGLRDRDLSMEVMGTRNAVGAYNVLAQESRRVAAFLWPAGEEGG